MRCSSPERAPLDRDLPNADAGPTNAWMDPAVARAPGAAEHFATFGDRLLQPLWDELAAL
jgi:hypothetical protein